MTEKPTTDSTPAWFTPPDDAAPAPPRKAPVQAPPSPPPAPVGGFHITAPPPVPADGFHITAPPLAPVDGFHITAPAPEPARAPAPAPGFHVTKPSGTFAFTPPNTAPVGAAAPAPRPAPAAAPAQDLHVTGPSDMFAVTPPSTASRPATGSSVDFWPVGSPRQDPAPAPATEEPHPHRAPLSPLTAGPAPSATALAPPTPLVRPIITITPASTPTLGVEVVEPRRPEAEIDDGGRGWRVRAGHSSSSDHEPPKPTGILLDPQMAAEQAAFVMPRMSWEKQERHRPTRRYVLFGAGLLALSGLAALTLTTVGGFAHGIHQPQTIGGLAQVDTPSVQTTLDSLDSYERSAGASNVVTGAYGTQDQTQVMLVVVQSSQMVNGGTPAALQGFVHGIVTGASSVGWTLDPSKITTTTLDGTTFECDQGPASANGGAILSMCAWTDPGTAGAVVDITGSSLTDVLNETVQARAASQH